jgi:hypothetical protein
MMSSHVDAQLKAWLYLENIHDANVHWFFEQAIRAYDGELYLASALSYITGIEALLRKAAKPLENPDKVGAPEYLHSVSLSNALLRKFQQQSVDVSCFRFPDETNDIFLEKLKTKKDHVRLVQLRHDINHGNIQHFIQETDEGETIFTPNMLQSVCKILEPMPLEFLKNLKGSKS